MDIFYHLLCKTPETLLCQRSFGRFFVHFFCLSMKKPNFQGKAFE